MAMAVLKPSINFFALLESDDPGNTRLADLDAKAKADAAARRPREGAYYKKQPLQMSAWKKNKLKAEAEAAFRQRQQALAASTKTITAGKYRKPQQPAAVTSSIQLMTTGNVVATNNRKPQQPAVVAPRAQANAAMNMKPTKQPAVASRAQLSAATNAGTAMKPKQPAASEAEAHVNATANADDNEQSQQPPARASLADQLFAYANRVCALIYRNYQKQNASPANVKNGVPKNDAPKPVKEEPAAAPIKPVLPPPPPSLEDPAQFPSLK